MKRILLGALLVSCLLANPRLSPKPESARAQDILSKDHDTNVVERVQAALRTEGLKYLNGLTSYWEPQFSTTLVYGGDAADLNQLMAALRGVPGMKVRLTFSKDLSKETGSALSAGSWWVRYAHTDPDTISIRVNLAASAMEKLEIELPKDR